MRSIRIDSHYSLSCKVLCHICNQAILSYHNDLIARPKDELRQILPTQFHSTLIWRDLLLYFTQCGP